MPSRFVIVGGGLAGAKAAETLRKEGFDGEVVLVGGELWQPYERPPLSKDLLLGKADALAPAALPRGWYAAHDVRAVLGVRATALDPAAHSLTLGPLGDLAYDRLLLATGATARQLNVPGIAEHRPHYLRTLDDSLALRAAVADGGKSVVVVGGGWIGLEVAAAAQGYGNRVTVIEPEPVPLARALGAELGGFFAELHRANGVEVRTGEGVKELRDGQAITTAGRSVPFDVLVVGVGAVPETGLAAAAGLDVDNGVLVDAGLRTSAADVYAAGDVANVLHPFYRRRVRVEHWANALHGGPAAARAMLGQDVSYDRLPYFFSDQYDLGMEFTGLVDEADRVVYRGDVAAREFIAFWLAGDRLVAGMNVNVWDVVDEVRELIVAGRPVDAGRLADPSVPLGEVAG